MCGIFSLLNTRGFSPEFINTQFEKGKNRGPEYSKLESFNDSDFFLGFHRLAINGLNEKSNQPILINDIIRLERVNVNRHISNSRKKTSNGLTIIVIVVELFFFLIKHQYPYPRHADGDEEDLVDIWALITEAKAGAQVHEQRR